MSSGEQLEMESDSWSRESPNVAPISDAKQCDATNETKHDSIIGEPEINSDSLVQELREINTNDSNSDIANQQRQTNLENVCETDRNVGLGEGTEENHIDLHDNFIFDCDSQYISEAVTKETHSNSRPDIEDMALNSQESVIKIAKTFSLAAVDYDNLTDAYSAVHDRDYLEECQDDYVLTDLDSHKITNKGHTLFDFESNRQLPSASQPHISSEVEGQTIAQSDLCTVSAKTSKKVIHEKIGVSIVDLDHYEENQNDFKQSKIKNSKGIDTANESTNFYSAEIHVISCDNQIDFLSENAPKVVLSAESNICSDHSYYHPIQDNVQSNNKSRDQQMINQCLQDVSSSDMENADVWTSGACSENMSDCNDQYKEFNEIFQAVDDYQPLYEENFVNIDNEFMGQNYVKSECDPQCMTGFKNQPQNEELKSDSGIFGSSLQETESSPFITSYNEKDQTDNFPLLNQLLDSNQTQQCNMYQKCDVLPTVTPRRCTPAELTCPDNGTKYTHQQLQQHLSRQPPYTDCQYKCSPTATAGSTTVNAFDKSLLDTSSCDPYLNDYSRTCPPQVNHFYEGTPAYPLRCYQDWSSWPARSALHDINSNPGPSRQLVEPNNWALPSTSIRDDVTTPEIVQFLKLEAKEEDDEETDDADEFDDVPMTYYTSALDNTLERMASGSVATSSYHSDDSCSIMTAYSPASLTPPPSASSTPVLSCNLESRVSEESGFFSPWSVSHLQNPVIHRPSPMQLPPCKLSSEQLETGLLNYGLKQGIKRPFPSMADAMRNSRSKSAAKKFGTEPYREMPRRCGRPRKNQIQSDKISTSTTMKNKKKGAMKNNMDTLEHDRQDEDGDALASSGSRRSGRNVSRHNEPLNQYAIEIMTQWFDEHVHNPYPSKADKEKMAHLGGISESQVKSWFANKRNRTNNTKPKVQKRAMEEKLKELFRDLKRSHGNPTADNSHLIQQLSGIIQHCHTTKLE